MSPSPDDKNDSQATTGKRKHNEDEIDDASEKRGANNASPDKGSAQHVSKTSQNGYKEGDQIVTILVGPDKVAFYAPKQFLCNQCQYFQAALSGGFLEGRTHVLEFPDDEPAMWKHLLHWFCFGALKMTDAGERTSEEWRVLCRLYIFGQMRGIIKLQNDAIDEIIEKHSRLKRTANSQLDYIYENTIKGDPLRRLFVDLGAHSGILNAWMAQENAHKKFPPTYLRDLVTTLYEMREKRDKSKVSQ